MTENFDNQRKVSSAQHLETMYDAIRDRLKIQARLVDAALQALKMHNLGDKNYEVAISKAVGEALMEDAGPLTNKLIKDGAVTGVIIFDRLHLEEETKNAVINDFLTIARDTFTVTTADGHVAYMFDKEVGE